MNPGTVRVIFAIPDYYSFLTDEIRSLAACADHVYVLCSSPPPHPPPIHKPNVTFIHAKTGLGSVFLVVRRMAFMIKEFGVYGFLRNLSSLHELKDYGLYGVLRNLNSLHEICSVFYEAEMLARGRRADVIHSHFAFPHGYGGMFSEVLPTIVTLRGYDILLSDNYGYLWKPFFRKNLFRSASCRVTFTVASQTTLEAARTMLHDAKDFRLIPNGIDVRDFTTDPEFKETQFGITPNDIVLVSVGNLIKRKNVDMIIRSLADLNRDLNFKLVLCGDGPERKKLESLCAECGVEKKVVFAGRVNRRVLTSIYKRAEILIHAPFCEGFGNVILEAMLHEVCVVATRTGAARDLIVDGENGFLANVNDQADLNRKVELATMLARSRPAFLEGNRILVESEYDISGRVEAFSRLYREAILKPRAHGRYSGAQNAGRW